MQIAQIAPLMEAVPPKLYGGTERIVAYLTDELVAMGHEVTLFASGDSSTTANLEPGCERALRLDPTVRDSVAPLLAMLENQRSGLLWRLMRANPAVRRGLERAGFEGGWLAAN